MKTNTAIYVTPKLGSGGVNLRNQPVGSNDRQGQCKRQRQSDQQLSGGAGAPLAQV